MPIDVSNSQTTEYYTTNAMYLAAWLIITQKLKYLGAKVNPANGQGVFVFDDPEGIAPELEREFLTGDPAVSIRRIKDTLQMLRDHLRRAGGR